MVLNRKQTRQLPCCSHLEVGDCFLLATNIHSNNVYSLLRCFLFGFPPSLQEALCEMNDELQENSRDTERELREEIEQGRTQISQLVRHVDACRETIADYEKTLSKFRDLVTDLQAQNTELRRSLADGKRQHEVQLQQHVLPQTSEALKRASLTTGIGLVSQSQTMAKMIEGDLRRLEAEQSNAHVARLTAFLPESFLRRGGDYDALLTLLLIDRLASKTDLLATHVSEWYFGSLHTSACLVNTHVVSNNAVNVTFTD